MQDIKTLNFFRHTANKKKNVRIWTKHFYMTFYDITKLTQPTMAIRRNTKEYNAYTISSKN